MRLRLVFSEALRSLGANLSTTVAATMTVLIGMFLLGLLIAFASYVVSYSDHLKSELLVKVYFQPEPTEQQINGVRIKLESDPRVQEVKFVSAEEALERMRERYPALTRGLSSNPLPASFEVKPHRGEDTEAIASALRPLPAGVDKVNYGKKAARSILRFAAAIEAISVVAILVLLSASTLLIANTIRLSIFSRRREIEVMKLVGATNWFVRGPFMLEGLICGVFGALVAIFLLLLGKEFALPAIRISEGAEAQALSFFWNAMILLAVGLLLGAAGSGLTLRRFLKV